ncbi:MAG: hypothetical protein V4543_07355 [Bacteroidota bacterium]
MNKPLCLLFLCLILISGFKQNASAQTAYHGGPGDGHAFVAVNNVEVGIIDHAFSLSVFPNPAVFGREIQILLKGSGSNSTGAVNIYNLAGETVASGTINLVGEHAKFIAPACPGFFFFCLALKGRVYRTCFVVIPD